MRNLLLKSLLAIVIGAPAFASAPASSQSASNQPDPEMRNAYLATKKIYALVAQVLKEGVALGAKYEFSDKDECSSPASSRGRTKQGFYLINDGSNPHAIKTPFGEKTLPHITSGGFMHPLWVSQQVAKRLNVTFEWVDKPGSTYPEQPIYYQSIKEVTPQNFNLEEERRTLYEATLSSREAADKAYDETHDEYLKKIPYEETKTKRGTRTLIKSETCGYKSFYKIGGIDNEQLPEPEVLYFNLHSYEEWKKSGKEAEKAWDSLKSIYGGMNKEEKKLSASEDKKDFLPFAPGGPRL